MFARKRLIVAGRTSVCVALLVGCSHREIRDVQGSLRPIGDVFGISWPTNCSRQVGSVLRYRAPLDGGSANTELIARLEVSTSDYLLWRHTVTNALYESEGGPVRTERRLSEKYSWWDPHKQPAHRATTFSAEKIGGTYDLALLHVVAIESENKYFMYVEAHLVKR